MASGVLAGSVLTLITSFTEVSTSIMITPINQSFKPIFPFSPLADPLTKGIYDEINRGGAGSLVAGNMGLIQLLVAGIGMAITQKLLGEKTGTAFGGYSFLILLRSIGKLLLYPLNLLLNGTDFSSIDVPEIFILLFPLVILVTVGFFVIISTED